MAMTRFASGANIVFGGLFVFWSILAEGYLLFMHSAPAQCEVTSVLVGNTCVPLGYILIAPILLGIFLMFRGSVQRPVEAEAEDLLRTDPYTMTVLSCFGSLAAFSIMALAVVMVRDTVYGIAPRTILVRGAEFTQVDAFGFLAGLFMVVTAVAVMVNWTHVRRRQRFIRGYTRAIARHRPRA